MQTATQNKSFLLVGSYKTHLPIKQMNKEAKASNKRTEAIKRKSTLERKKILLRCAITTEKDLTPVGVC